MSSNLVTKLDMDFIFFIINFSPLILFFCQFKRINITYTITFEFQPRSRPHIIEIDNVRTKVDSNLILFNRE